MSQYHNCQNNEAETITTTVRCPGCGEPQDNPEQCLKCGWEITPDDFRTLEPKQEAAPFVIDSDSRADWYLEKLLTVQARRDVLNAQVERMRRELESEEAGLKARYGQQFEAFAREKIAGKRGKGKTHDFFFGRVSVRTVPGRWAVGDVETALQSAKLVCPAAVVTVEKLDRSLLLQHVEDTGEIVPGVERLDARESFAVKFSTTASEAVEHVEENE